MDRGVDRRALGPFFGRLIGAMHRIGIMGAGVVADYGHAPAIASTPGLELTSLYDPNPKALIPFRNRYPWLRTYTDPDSFLHSGIDSVTVTSPAPAHADNVVRAAHAGKPVLCEKPIALNETDAESMQEAMAKAQRPLGVAFCYRFSSVAKTIRQIIRSGEIGEVKLLRLVYLWNLHGKWEMGPEGIPWESPRRIGRFVEGGPMVDCGVHQIDLARWWTGSEVDSYDGDGAWVEDHTAPGHMWVHLRHRSGCRTTVEVSFSYGATLRDPVDIFTYEVLGTDGMIRYTRDGWRFEVRTPRETRYLPGAGEKDFHTMYAAWKRVLDTGTLGDFPGADDARVVSRIAGDVTTAVMRRSGPGGSV